MTMHGAFTELHAAYQARDLGWRKWQQPGQAVVGYVGNTVPRELIDASGALAWRVAPIDGDPAAADASVEAFSDPDARRIFTRYCEGQLDELSLLVIPRSSETQHKLYLALREARRVGITRRGPPLVLYDVLHTQRETSRLYGLARTQELQRVLGAIDEPALAVAIAERNRTRALLAHVQRRREQGLSGWQAQVATGATWFLPPAKANALLVSWLDESPPMPPVSGPRLLVRGVPLDHAELHALVEAAGGDIVAEDDDWGARAAEPLIDTTLPPLQAVFEHHWRDVPCPRRHPDPLAGSWFERRLNAGGMDAVLFHHPRPDDIYGWPFPAERALVERLGLPWLRVRDDARHPTTRAALQAQLQAFFEHACPTTNN